MKTIKLLLLGISMFFTGFIIFAILVVSAIASNSTLDGSNYFMDIWSIYGITPIAIGFFILGILGLIIAIIGLFQKSK